MLSRSWDLFHLLINITLDFSEWNLNFFNLLILQEEKGRPLPKFGEWDVNDPASADGFTVIFSKAKDDKRASGNADKYNNTVLKQNKSYKYP